MIRQENKVTLRGLKNYYCDVLSCVFGEFLTDEEISNLKLTDEELQTVCDYAVLKNKQAGVGEVNLKVPKISFGVKSLEKYGLIGKEIIDAEKIGEIETKMLVGERLMVELSSLTEYDQNFLSNVSNFVALIDCEILIRLGQDLEEVGKAVNRYNLSPVSILESFGFLDRKCIVYGLNFIDKDDQKLLKDYETQCVFSPRSDAEIGRGAINLYNFIYNELKFGFSSEKCYNIDMLGEVKLAINNTSNLMYESGLLDNEILLQSLQSNYGENEIEMLSFEKEDNIFDKRISKPQVDLNVLREKIISIVKQIKENN